MGNNSHKRTSNKVLRHDPFADMDGFEWEQDPISDPKTVEIPTEVAEPFTVDPSMDTSSALDALEAGLMAALQLDETIVESTSPSARVIPTAVAEHAPEAEIDGTHILDDLIDSIDTELAAVYGLDNMASAETSQQLDSDDQEQHIIFTLAGTMYTVPIGNVTEIGQPLTLTPIPNVPNWVLGVANLRGDIISMVDLRTFLGLESLPYRQDSRMLVAQTSREDMTVGLIIDQVNGISYLPSDQIETPTAPIEDQITPYLRGVYEQNGNLLVVLSLEKLLLSPAMRQFEPI